MTRKRDLVSLLGLALLLVLGCSKANPNAPASLHGKVTYKGQPVTGGTLTLYASDNQRIPMTIDAEGLYGGTDLPSGECTVTVDTEGLKPKGSQSRTVQYGAQEGHAEGGKAMMNYNDMMRRIGKVPDSGSTKVTGVYVKIPSRYSKKDSSPLRVTLTRGDQKHDFELTAD